MKRLLFFLLLFQLCAHAQYPKFVFSWPYTRVQDPALNDSLITNPETEIHVTYKYNSNIPYHEHADIPVFNRQKGLQFDRWYHNNGKARAEGFAAREGDRGMLNKHHGIWFYYDTLGRLYRQFDNEKNALTKFENPMEHSQFMFDSMLVKANTFLEKRFSKQFIDQYLRLVMVNWTEPNTNYMGFLPELPFKRPVITGLHFWVAINDTVTHNFITMVYDPSLKLISVSGVDTAAHYGKLKVGFEQARKIAMKKGFDGNLRFGTGVLNKENKKRGSKKPVDFYWTNYRHDTVKYSGKDFWFTETYLNINARTGRAIPEKNLFKEQRYDFGNDGANHRQVRTKSNQPPTTIRLKQMELQKPVNWRVVIQEGRMGVNKTLNFILGPDTFALKQDCKSELGIVGKNEYNDLVTAEKIRGSFTKEQLHNWTPLIEVRKQNGGLWIHILLYIENSRSSCGIEQYHIIYSSAKGNLEGFLQVLAGVEMK